MYLAFLLDYRVSACEWADNKCPHPHPSRVSGVDGIITLVIIGFCAARMTVACGAQGSQFVPGIWDNRGYRTVEDGFEEE